MCARPGKDVRESRRRCGPALGRRGRVPQICDAGAGRGGAGLFCHWIQLDTYRRVLEPLASRSVRGVETFIRRVRILRSNENVAYISTAVFRLHGRAHPLFQLVFDHGNRRNVLRRATQPSLPVLGTAV